MKDINDNETMDILEPKKTCKQCGIEESENNQIYDFYDDCCEQCEEKNSRKRDDFYLTISIVSKMIHSNVSKGDLKILHYIMYNVADYKLDENFELNHTDIARGVYQERPNVSRSIKKLLNAKILIKHDDNKYTISM